MRAYTLVPLAAIAVQAVRILQGNDDGWAELYVRSLNEVLNSAGHDVVLSAPAENQSGKGKDTQP
jgi:broad specificity polyphosphatase/5'/3'-nucleotidase SurE